jgi:hypothetical protein
MASGKFGNAMSVANTNVTVFTATSLSTANINVTNIGASPATVKIAIAAADAPVDKEWIDSITLNELNSASGRNTLERTGFALTAGEKVVIFASTATVAVRVHGYEEV